MAPNDGARVAARACVATLTRIAVWTRVAPCKRVAPLRALRTPLLLAILLAACDTSSPDAPPWGRVQMPEGPDVDPVVADLGRLLFYDPVLGSDGETACATCHSEIWGMSDGLPVSIGVGGGRLTGPGRKGPSQGTRNAPTLWNVAFREGLFWDGRETSLEHQLLAPLDSPIELDRPIGTVLAELRSIPEYVARFEAAFPDAPEPLTEATFEAALAALQRTLIASRSLYDAFVGGDALALSDLMRQGMRRFADLGCDGCHVPPFFESEAYFDRGLPSADRGRVLVTGDPADERAFRVPTLRNAQLTEPYFHDGSVPTLEAAIAHEIQASTGAAAAPDDVTALAAFIGRALVDRSREPDRPEVVPSGLPVPEDGFRILRP